MYITTRVHNSKSVQLPYGYYLDRMTSAISRVNTLSCAIKMWAFHTANYTSTLEWLHVKYLLSVFTADCLRHPILMGIWKNRKRKLEMGIGNGNGTKYAPITGAMFSL